MRDAEPPGQEVQATLPPEASAVPPLRPARVSRISPFSAAVVASSAVAVALASLFATGVFSLAPAGAGESVGLPVPYPTALPAAEAVSQNESGGPWTLVEAVGIRVSSSVTGPDLAVQIGSGCTMSPASGAPSSFTLVGTPASAALGQVAGWVFLAKNSTSLLLIGMNASATVPLGIVSNCTGVAQVRALGPIENLSVVNPSIPVMSFNGAGGASFLASNVVDYQAFGLFGNSSAFYGDAVWGIFYSTCSLTATSGASSALVAAYDAATGGALVPPTKVSMNC